MSNDHDAYARSALSRPDITADLLRHAFPVEVIEQLDLDALRLIDGRLGDDRLRSEIETDFLWELTTRDGDPVLVYLLLEHQSSVDHWMAFRLLRYRVRVWEAFRVREPKAPLPPVLPLVLYHGDRAWSAPADVAHLASPLDDDTTISARYRVIDISNWSDDQVLNLAVGAFTQLALLALANSRRNVTLESRLQAWVGLIRRIVGMHQGFEFAVSVLNYSLRVLDIEDPRFARSILRSIQPKLEDVVTPFMKRMQDEGRAVGLQQGRDEQRRAVLKRMLEQKFGPLDRGTTERITSASPAQLDAWLDRVLTADSVERVFED